MSLERPIRVFTEIKQNKRNLFTHTNKSSIFPSHPDQLFDNKEVEVGELGMMNISTADRQISVTGIGDLILPPDRYSLTLRCKSSKDNLQDAKNSVKKRVDYIVQTLKNHCLKDDDFMIYQLTNHADCKANIDCEVEAHFTDLTKCQSVSNLLAEKLGPAVCISMPRCYHAKGSLDKIRKQASMLAIHNARNKAKEMARVVHLGVGAALKVEETGATETHGTEEKNDDDFDCNPSIQQRVSEATVSISTAVNVCFQLKPSKKY